MESVFKYLQHHLKILHFLGDLCLNDAILIKNSLEIVSCNSTFSPQKFYIKRLYKHNLIDLRLQKYKLWFMVHS